MEWLVALLVLLGLGAFAGLVWLHFGRGAGEPSGSSLRRPAPDEAGSGAERAELSTTISYLRRRASHYREMAVKVDDAITDRHGGHA